VEPAPETVTEATFCQVAEPPLMTGVEGAVLSIRTVSVASGTAGAQADVNPATSTVRNWTSVSPWAVTTSDPPPTGAVHVLPPSVEVRC
jgi:hypothetical protein